MMLNSYTMEFPCNIGYIESTFHGNLGDHMCKQFVCELFVVVTLDGFF